MATCISMKHKTTGIIKDGFYGYSWTTLFFGFFPALFRGDFVTFMGVFVVVVILAFVTWGVGCFVAMFVWAFIYNDYYTKKLLERGYEFAGTPEENEAAATALNVRADNRTGSDASVDKEQRSTLSTFGQGGRTLENDAYKIYLVKQYKIEFNETLRKHIFNDALYESVDDALVAVHAFDVEKVRQAEIEAQIKLQTLLSKTSPPANADSVCPNGNCSAPVRYDDQTCWKCEADFSHPQGWKPIRS